MSTSSAADRNAQPKKKYSQKILIKTINRRKKNKKAKSHDGGEPFAQTKRFFSPITRGSPGFGQALVKRLP